MGRHSVQKRRAKFSVRARQNIDGALAGVIVLSAFALLPLFAVPIPLTEWALAAPVHPPHLYPASSGQPVDLPIRRINIRYPARPEPRESLIADTRPLVEPARFHALPVGPRTDERIQSSHHDRAASHADPVSHVVQHHTDSGINISEHQSHDSSTDHHSDAGSHNDDGHSHGGGSHGGHGDSHGGGGHSGGHGGGGHGGGHGGGGHGGGHGK